MVGCFLSLFPDPRSMLFAIVTARSHITNNMDLGSVLVVGKVRSKITSQPEVVPGTVIIKALIPGAYLSYIILLTSIVK